jgi:predicted acylesterase/phospholipase RssA
MEEPWLLSVRYLVFSGGGARGLAFFGCLKALKEVFLLLGKNLLEEMQGFGGSSIGALVALACVTLLDSDEIHKWAVQMNSEMQGLLAKMDPSNFIQGRLGLVRNTVLNKNVEKLIRMRFNRPDITFRELYEITHKTLHIPTSNISTGKLEIYNPEHTPDAFVGRIVVTSMAMPGVFFPTKMNGHLYVDGGLYDNFPLKMFPADAVLGFRLRTKTQIDETPSLLEYFFRTFSSAMDYHEDEMLYRLPQPYHERVITVEIPSSSSTEILAIPPNKIDDYIRYGEQATHTYMFRNFFMGQYFAWLLKRISEVT